MAKNKVPTPPQLPKDHWAEARKIYEEEMKKAYDKGWSDGFEAGKSGNLSGFAQLPKGRI